MRRFHINVGKQYDYLLADKIIVRAQNVVQRIKFVYLYFFMSLYHINLHIIMINITLNVLCWEGGGHNGANKLVHS